MIHSLAWILAVTFLMVVNVLILGNGWARFAPAPPSLRRIVYVGVNRGYRSRQTGSVTSECVATEVSVWFVALIRTFHVEVTLSTRAMLVQGMNDAVCPLRRSG